MVKAELMQEVVDGKNYWFPPSVPALDERSPIACLLPNFDEYMIGYKDRSAMFPAAYSGKLSSEGKHCFQLHDYHQWHSCWWLEKREKE